MSAVACPGRLEESDEHGDINLSAVDVAVVDEADRLADMGFLPAVCRILDATSPERQTLLFSATLDGDVDVLVRRYQRNPVRHEVSEREAVSGASHEFRPVASAGRTARVPNSLLRRIFGGFCPDQAWGRPGRSRIEGRRRGGRRDTRRP